MLRGPEKSSAEASSPWITETFWCITVEPGGAFISAPTWLPTSTGAVHQPSLQARTPRVAHWSAKSRSLSYTARGIAPRLWLTR